MPPKTDKRLSIGATVTTRAKLVTSKSQCQRLFGSNWNTALFYGTVHQIQIRSHKGRRSRHLLCHWHVGQETKQSEHPLSSIQYYDAALSNNPILPPAPSDTQLQNHSPSTFQQAPFPPNEQLNRTTNTSNQSRPHVHQIQPCSHQNQIDSSIATETNCCSPPCDAIVCDRIAIGQGKN